MVLAGAPAVPAAVPEAVVGKLLVLARDSVVQVEGVVPETVRQIRLLLYRRRQREREM